MRLKNTVAVTEKGVVKTDVRKRLMAFVMKDPVNAMTKAEPVDGKNTFTIPVTDVDGNTVYINFDVTVSAKNPADRAERTRKPKAKAETEAVEID